MMRHHAFLEATGEAVAVIEDHVIVPPDWGQQLLGALGEGHDVVGGTIVNAATTRLLDWGTFLCEYSACLPPLPAGPADWLPGNNVAYRRAVLERYRRVTAEGKWENRLHDAMRADGIQLVRVPGIVVGHKKHFGFFEYLSQRYLYSRSYAGARAAGASLPRRAAMGAAAFLLPVLLFLRIEAALHSKGVPLRLRLATLPMMLPFVASWAAGEIVGYWAGGRCADAGPLTPLPGGATRRTGPRIGYKLSNWPPRPSGATPLRRDRNTPVPPRRSGATH